MQVDYTTSSLTNDQQNLITTILNQILTTAAGKAVQSIFGANTALLHGSGVAALTKH
jgi:hypothetical protein